MPRYTKIILAPNPTNLDGAVEQFVNYPTSSSPSDGIGYTVGSGGAVTQLTSRSTGVTLNTVTGQITGNNASLAADAAVSFTVTNSQVLAGDTIVVSLKSGGSTTTAPFVTAVAAGSFQITLVNLSPTTADTTTPVLSFAIVRGSGS